MKKFTIEVSGASTPQLSTIALELKIMANAWERFGPEIELQAPSVKRILDHGTSNKPQAPSRKRHNIAMFR